MVKAPDDTTMTLSGVISQTLENTFQSHWRHLVTSFTQFSLNRVNWSSCVNCSRHGRTRRWHSRRNALLKSDRSCSPKTSSPSWPCWIERSTTYSRRPSMPNPRLNPKLRTAPAPRKAARPITQLRRKSSLPQRRAPTRRAVGQTAQHTHTHTHTPVLSL